MIFDPDVKILHNFLITYLRLPPWWGVAWRGSMGTPLWWRTLGPCQLSTLSLY